MHMHCSLAPQEIVDVSLTLEAKIEDSPLDDYPFNYENGYILRPGWWVSFDNVWI